jgi:hypothetical protein
MLKKFIGDKASIEARSDDQGRRWEIKHFDRGHLTTYTGANQADLDKLVAKTGMRAAPPR